MYIQKIILVFGTRPEAIKMAPLVLKLKSNPKVNLKVCITAQHRHMLDQVLDFFEITPDFDLDLMKKNQSLNELASRILSSFDQVLETENQIGYLFMETLPRAPSVHWQHFIERSK